MRMRLSNLSGNPWLWRVLLGGYWLTLLVLTHLPRDVPLGPVQAHDKILHAAAFAVLAALLAVTLQMNAGASSLPQLGGAWLAIIIYAGLDEWTQPFVGRMASIWDWVADAVGAALGLALFIWFRQLGQARSDDNAADAKRTQ